MSGLVPLEEACELVTDGTHFTPKNVGKGLPFLTVKDVSDSGLDFVNCSFISDDDYRAAKEGNSAPQPGDVLFSKDGTVGKVHVVTTDRPFAVLSSLAILRPIQGEVDAAYLGHALRSPQVLEEALRKKTGSAIRRIVLADLKRVRISLPSLAEQRRIASVLDGATALRAKRRAALAQLDTLTQSVFLDMFGDPVANPKAWPIVSLGPNTDKIGSGATPTGGESVYKAAGTALIRSMNVRDGSFLRTDLAYIDVEQAAKLDGVVVRAQDVLLNITGASVARVCLVPGDVLPARVNQHVAIIRPKKTLDATFLAELLRSASVKKQLLKTAGTGATREALTKSQLEDLRIIQPPGVLQQEFARRVAAVGQLKAAHAASLAQLDTLFASLQHHAFRGEL